MQDIAGCRLVVADVHVQDAVVDVLRMSLNVGSIVDRRLKPSHGYRSVHLVAMHDGRPIEIQIRTRLQHVWAELSEKAADVIDPSIKYGGGPEAIRSLLDQASVAVMSQEKLTTMHADVQQRLAAVHAQRGQAEHDESELAELRSELIEVGQAVAQGYEALEAVLLRAMATMSDWEWEE